MSAYPLVGGPLDGELAECDRDDDALRMVAYRDAEGVRHVYLMAYDQDAFHHTVLSNWLR